MSYEWEKRNWGIQIFLKLYKNFKLWTLSGSESPNFNSSLILLIWFMYRLICKLNFILKSKFSVKISIIRFVVFINSMNLIEFDRYMIDFWIENNTTNSLYTLKYLIGLYNIFNILICIISVIIIIIPIVLYNIFNWNYWKGTNPSIFNLK